MQTRIQDYDPGFVAGVFDRRMAAGISDDIYRADPT
jgi:hypothetical protein